MFPEPTKSLHMLYPSSGYNIKIKALLPNPSVFFVQFIIPFPGRSALKGVERCFLIYRLQLGRCAWTRAFRLTKLFKMAKALK